MVSIPGDIFFLQCQLKDLYAETKLSNPLFSTGSNDGNSCTTDVCNAAGACENSAPIQGCCGNGICETGESDSCSSDCGPFTLATSQCIGACFTPNEVKFNVNATNDIMIQNLTITVNPKSTMTVTVYSTTGGYESAEDGDWIQVANGTFPFPSKKV